MTQNRPDLVSIIIPAKNEEKNIERCLKSCFAQTYQRVEIIVIDNFSKDKTIEIAKKFTKKIYRKGPERSAQRNFGASKAKGKFLLFIDADMEITSNLIKDCLKQKTDSVIIPEKVPHLDFWSKCRDFEKSLYINDDLVTAPRFFQKRLFEKLKGYNTNLYAAEDWDLAQGLQRRGIASAHSQSFLIHNEGPISLIKLVRKKFYYGRNLKHYAKKYRQNTIYYIARPTFFKNYKKIISHPILFGGILALKLLEYLSIGSGFIVGYLKK